MASPQDLLLAYDPDFTGFAGGRPPGEAPPAHPLVLGGTADPDGYYDDFMTRLNRFVAAHPGPVTGGALFPGAPLRDAPLSSWGGGPGPDPSPVDLRAFIVDVGYSDDSDTSGSEDCGSEDCGSEDSGSEDREGGAPPTRAPAGPSGEPPAAVCRCAAARTNGCACTGGLPPPSLLDFAVRTGGRAGGPLPSLLDFAVQASPGRGDPGATSLRASDDGWAMDETGDEGDSYETFRVEAPAAEHFGGADAPSGWRPSAPASGRPLRSCEAPSSCGASDPRLSILDFATAK